MLLLPVLAEVAAKVVTTTSTGVTSVPPAAFTVGEILTFVFSATLAVITAVGGSIAIIDFWQKQKDKRKAAKREEDGPVLDRLTTLEGLVKRFRTFEELDRDFNELRTDLDHLKSNHVASTSYAREAIDSLRTNMTRMETKFENMATNTQRIESSVDRLGERMEERMDKIQDLIINSKR